MPATPRIAKTGPQPKLTIRVATRTLDKPSKAPTERSMPAVMITKVMPSAIIPVSEMARTMLAMLSGARKSSWPLREGEKTTPQISTSTSPITL